MKEQNYFEENYIRKPNEYYKTFKYLNQYNETLKVSKDGGCIHVCGPDYLPYEITFNGEYDFFLQLQCLERLYMKGCAFAPYDVRMKGWIAEEKETYFEYVSKVKSMLGEQLIVRIERENNSLIPIGYYLTKENERKKCVLPKPKYFEDISKIDFKLIIKRVKDYLKYLYRFVKQTTCSFGDKRVFEQSLYYQPINATYTDFINHNHVNMLYRKPLYDLKETTILYHFDDCEMIERKTGVTYYERLSLVIESVLNGNYCITEEGWLKEWPYWKNI